MKLRILGTVLLAFGLTVLGAPVAAQAVALASTAGPSGCLECQEGSAQCPQAGYHYDLPSPTGAYKNNINATGGYCHRADGCDVHPACGSALLIQERSTELAEAAEAGGMRSLATLLVGMDWRVDQGLGGVTVQSCNGADVLLWIPLAPEQIRVLQSATAGKVAANIVGAFVQG